MYQHFQASGDQTHPPVYSTRMPPSHTLSPADQYASYLRSVYTSKKLPTYSKWPPSSSKKYIHLAVVKKERVSKREADAFTRKTIHGTEIDNIYQKKEAVDFSKIGIREDGSLAKLILVVGAPGIGKTTFAWEVCRKWANGEILQEYGLVVLLRLRDKRVREVKSVVDLFYHSDPELQRAVAKEVQYHEGQSVLLLYEGYDELPRRLQEQQSIFHDVLHKQYLPQASILITSRPSATGYLHWEFREQISQHIEILGFTKDDITSYVYDVMTDEQLSRDFLQYLKCYPYIRGMMYVPLNAVIVTEVYKSSLQSPEKFIPTTMTELYTNLTRSILLRYLLSHSEYGQQNWNLKSFTDLPKELYKQFCCITEVALKGMIEDKFVFDDLPNDFNTLDLMQSVPELYVGKGALTSYNFFHLTLQEYLAAVSISLQPIQKQIEFFQISSRPGSPYSDEEYEFPETVDLDKSSHPPEPCKTSFLHIAPLRTHHIPSRDHTTYQSVPKQQHQPLLQRALSRSFMQEQFQPPTSPHERQLTPLLPPPSHQASSTSSISTPRHSHFHPYARPFAPQHQSLTLDVSSSRLSSRATFSTCTPTPSILPHQIAPSIVPPHPLPLTAQLHPPYATPNTTVPQSEASSTQLSLPDINIPGVSTRLTNVLRFVAGLTKFKCIPIASLQPLLLQDQWPWEDGAEMTLKSLHWLFETQCSDMYNKMVSSSPQLTFTRDHSFGSMPTTRSMSPFDCFVLGYAIAHVTCHWKINLFGTNIGDEGVEMLVSGMNFDKENFTQSDYSVSLYLRNCDITSEGLDYLSKIPKHVSQSMTELDFNSNEFGDRGATALAEMLKENGTLQQLDVSGNFIGQEGATALAEMLKENRTLQQLDVSDNSIGQGGATALAEMLKENRTLQQLDVSYNSIGQGGAIPLAQTLKQNGTLQQLDVSGNFIGQEGATALAEMLKENRTLQRLNVSDNSIGQGGATALAEILKENVTLQQLNVSHNSIGQGGATALAEILKENVTLQQLNVSYNSIGQGGATALAEILKENVTLQQLNVSYNSIGQGGATALAEMLKKNRSLKSLLLYDYSIGEEGTTILVESLKYNTTLETLGLPDQYGSFTFLSPAQKGRIKWHGCIIKPTFNL